MGFPRARSFIGGPIFSYNIHPGPRFPLYGPAGDEGFGSAMCLPRLCELFFYRAQNVMIMKLERRRNNNEIRRKNNNKSEYLVVL